MFTGGYGRGRDETIRSLAWKSRAGYWRLTACEVENDHPRKSARPPPPPQKYLELPH